MAARRPDASRRWRRQLTRHRRWLAAGSAALAVAAAVNALAPSGPATDPLQVAARDLPAGRIVQPSDLVTVAWPRGSRPDGVLAAPSGRMLAAGVRRGEPLTDTRVIGPGLLAGQPAGTVAVTVRLSDPAATVLLAPGRRVDLLAGPVSDEAAIGGADPEGNPGGSAGTGGGTGGRAQVLASNVLVLALPTQADTTGSSWPGAGSDAGAAGSGSVDGGADGGSGTDGVAGAASGVVVFAVDHDTAARLAAANGTRSISVVLTSPS